MVERTEIYRRRVKRIITLFLILSLAAGGYMGLFIGAMATDAPGSGIREFSLGFAFAFCLVFLPFGLSSSLALREWRKAEPPERHPLSMISACLWLCTALLPLAVYQLYLLNKIRKELNAGEESWN